MSNDRVEGRDAASSRRVPWNDGFGVLPVPTLKGKKMRVGESFTVNYMSGGNDSLWLWLDIKVLRFWYVLMWRKGLLPYMYRSTDATPPCDKNEGRWIFGRATGWRNY